VLAPVLLSAEKGTGHFVAAPVDDDTWFVAQGAVMGRLLLWELVGQRGNSLGLLRAWRYSSAFVDAGPMIED